MAAIDRIVVELPADLAERVRSAVQEGRFPSESEAVRAGLETLLQDDDETTETWLRDVVIARYDDHRAGSQTLLSADEVRRTLRTPVAAQGKA